MLYNTTESTSKAVIFGRGSDLHSQGNQLQFIEISRLHQEVVTRRKEIIPVID